MFRKALLAVCLGFLALTLQHYFWGGSQNVSGHTRKTATNQESQYQCTKEFNAPEVIKVTEGVHVAIGYALGNSIMLDAPEGLIIVDTTESLEAGQNVFKAFRNITNKPIKAIIFTHNHADHTVGAEAFIEDLANPPVIWAHHTTASHMLRSFTTVGQIIQKRAIRQFGVLLSRSSQFNCNLGTILKLFSSGFSSGVMFPTQFLYDDQQDVTIAGLEMRLIHIPGETPDHIGVWIPSKQVFLPGDNIYRAFPNLYAIRGTPHRDLMLWVDSLDKAIALQPKYLVPSHTRPLHGEKYIEDLLSVYRDAIQYIHDQTVRLMNKGLFPDEIVEEVVKNYPEKFARHPYLQELYGTVEWSSKGVFSGYLGWFSGDPVDLNPLNRKEKAKRMTALAGGLSALIQTAQKALDDGDHQWALELSSHALIIDTYDKQALDIKFKSLEALAETQTSTNGRYYYLTFGLEATGEVENKMNEKTLRTTLGRLPLSAIFSAFPLKLKAEKAAGVNTSATFNLTDVGETYKITIRNSVVLVRQIPSSLPDDSEVKIVTRSTVLREIFGRQRSVPMAYMEGDLIAESGIISVVNFLLYFDIGP